MEFKKALKAVVCDIDVPCRAYETSISCPAWKLRITCRACKLRITCQACKLRITCPAYNLRIACQASKLGITCRACKLRITCRACKLRITCPASNFFKNPLNHTQFSLGPLHAYAFPRKNTGTACELCEHAVRQFLRSEPGSSALRRIFQND